MKETNQNLLNVIPIDLLAMLQAIMGLSLAPPFCNTGISRVWLGPQPVVMLFTPETAEPLLSSNVLIEKAIFYNFIATWLGAGLLTRYDSFNTDN